MRVAGLVLGILGSVAGFFGALVAIFFGGVTGALGDEETGTTLAIACTIAIVASIVGLIGAIISPGKPKLGAGLMLASAIIGIIAVFVAYILGAVLLLIGALLAFIGRKEKQAAT